MKFLTFGTDQQQENVGSGSMMGAGELTRAPSNSVLAPPVPFQKPMSMWVPVGISVGVGAVLLFLLNNMQKSMDYDRIR